MTATDQPGIPVTVTWLEMRADPGHRVPMPSLRLVGGTLALLRAEKPPVAYYRFLYGEVGRSHHWVDRIRMADTDLARIIEDPAVEISVLYVGGVPAGYVELDCRHMPEVELAYFGLLPDFTGRNLGKYLLARAIGFAWARSPERLIVQTNTLDHPRALPLYQQLGFQPFRQDAATIYPLTDAEKIARLR